MRGIPAVIAVATVLAAPGSSFVCSGVRGTVQAAFGGVAAILPLRQEITDITVESLRRRIELAREKGVDIIIFDMDTPGGLVTSSIAIADMIKNLSDTKTVVWVNPNAHSGGAIVAVAADEIVMARSSRMGDSQVITIGPEGAGAVPEELQPKAYTPVLKEFSASARLNGYDRVLCEAFVLPDREVWWLENVETGERKFVFREEKLRLLGEKEDAKKVKAKKTATTEDSDEEDEDEPAEPAEPDEQPTTADSAGEPVEWKLVETYYDVLLGKDVDTDQPIVPDTQLLEMSAAEAHAWGFNKAIVADEDALIARYNLDKIIRIRPSWSEGLAFWLTSIYVRGFLMVIVMLGAYVEFHTPGVGVPGLVALICLGIVIGAPYLTGLATVWEIALIAIGIALMVLELFVIPGFGFAGIAGIAVFLIGLLATFIPDEPGRVFPIYLPTLPDTVHAMKVAILTMAASMTASLVGIVLLGRFLPQTTLFSRIAPPNPTPSDVRVEDPYHGAVRVGDIGVAEGPLHPSGKARFGSVLADVVTQGEYLEAETRLEVIEQRGNRVIVRSVV